MASSRPLPIAEAWDSPDAYIEELLSFSTTSVLFMNLCGGVHMVDFLTREPDVYTTLLPENWRSFFEQHQIQDIIHLLLREDIDHLRGAQGPHTDPGSRTWNGGAFPPESLLDYICNVRRLVLQQGSFTSPSKKIDLPKQVAMRMNRKKVHEVECFSQYVASLSDIVQKHQGEPVSHIVDFGSGQNYLGRTLVSSPYHKHIIAIERKHQYITGAKGMDVRAKLANDPKALHHSKRKDPCNDCNGTAEVNTSEPSDSPQPTTEGSQVSEDATAFDMLGEISLEPDELLGTLTKGSRREKLPTPEVLNRGTLSYIEHDIQDGYLEPIIEHVTKPSLDEDSEGADKKETNARVMVVSLHSCGNLVHHGLKSLIVNPSVVAVAMIGCCYNLLTERLGPATNKLPILQSLHPRLQETGSSYDPHGFPLSKYYEDYRSPGTTEGIRLNITARALAVQAPLNWTAKDSEVSFTRHYFRALFQRILVDRTVLPKPSASETPLSGKSHSESKADAFIIGSLPKSAYKSFNTYIRAATVKMSRDPIYGSRIKDHIATMTDEDIEHYEAEYLHTRKHISIVWSLMAFSAQLVESIIVVDRWQYLREQDSVKECWVEPVFEYGHSPRNLAVIGLKK
ncbi:uncharacterized protein N7484_007301 [Penicillium longicatenatum]|uniref:uncharacterized protein n=1 Tax=Penicillium longicatenatum TaxID=1561947 RepID=UPI002548B3FF|nr:uncharacterized protein N7484_007301 [Penicillium longicatenatum]KAJ5639439.1 hypothetical protein N7484_007301 [Penicillium longicatenatum]